MYPFAPDKAGIMQALVLLSSFILFLLGVIFLLRSFPRLCPFSRRHLLFASGLSCAVVLCVVLFPDTFPREAGAPEMEARPAGHGTLSEHHAMPNHVAILKVLYTELLSFKDDPEFHRVGFGLCCRFNAWKQHLERLDDGGGSRQYQDLGFVPGDLLILGSHYLGSRGVETSYTRSMSALIDAGLKPWPSLGVGQGVVRREERACVNIDTFRRYHAAVGARRHAEASRILSSTGCRVLYPKTIVNGPLDSLDVSQFGRGIRDSGAVYHQVRTDGGAILWLDDNQVIFR